MPLRILLDVPITFDVGAQTTHAPMVEVRVGAVTTKLILDTGSTDHVLTIELARAAGLDAEPGEPGTDHAGALVPSWTLGSVAATVGGLDVTLKDAVAIAGPAPFAGWGVGGFLSPQHLHPTALAVIDLAENRFMLIDDERDAVRAWLEARSPGLVSVASERATTHSTPVVQASIEPFPAVPTMLNTGGRGTEFVSSAVPGLNGVDPERLGLGVGGSAVHGSEVADRTLAVGEARAPVRKLFIRDEIEGTILGLVGMDVLRGTVLTLGADPGAGVLWLVPSSFVPDGNGVRVAARSSAAAPVDRRVMVKAAPFNAEASPAALDDPVTRVEDFYVRTNLGVPDIDPVAWRLAVDGLVERSLSLSLADLRAMPTRTVTCTIECAGNNRTRLEPITEGEPWGPGAISTGVFEGVPLDLVLDMAGLQPAAVELRFEGADRGVPRGRTDAIAYERSLPVADTVGGDLLLAMRLNEAPLTADHGAPVRLIVPGWYGMASVKWLGRIDVLDHALEAHYQTRQYRYYHDEPVGTIAAPPVRTMRLNSMISNPCSGDIIGPGPHEIRGAAWSGDAPIVAVDVSIDAGPWLAAELLGEALPYAWWRWRFAWPGAAAGRHSFRSRATAADGSIQPDRPDWNRLGYGNNAIAVTLVTVAEER